MIYYATHWLLVKKIDVHPYIKKKKANGTVRHAMEAQTHQFDRSVYWCEHSSQFLLSDLGRNFDQVGSDLHVAQAQHTLVCALALITHDGKNHRHKHFILIIYFTNEYDDVDDDDDDGDDGEDEDNERKKRADIVCTYLWK